MLALAFALAASCGGSTAPAAPSSSAPSASATAAPTVAVVTSAPAATPGGAGRPKLLDLLTAAKLASYKVTYHVTATDAAQSFSGDQTWYFAPPRARFDFSSTFAGQRTTISFFVLSAGAYYCFAVGGQTRCLSVGGIGSPLDQNFAVVVQRDLTENPDHWGGTFKDIRTIAGLQAYCYDVTSAAANTAVSSGTFCYSKDGIALLSRFSASGATWSMEATSVSATVPDSDFKLPAEPTKIP